MKKKYKHFFFDVDGTLTESRQVISNKVDLVISNLTYSGKDTIAISGASKKQMLFQLNFCFIDYIMAQSGNDTAFWCNKLTEEEITEIYIHANKITLIEKDMLENRGCQVAFSLVGHNALIEKKKEFDPTKGIRKVILKKFPFKSKTLICKVAGTTCLDYTRKNGTKGKNIAKLIKHLGWKKSECIYFGDALFKGGNDESVIKVIKTVEVSNPQDLLEKLSKYI